MLLGSLRKVPLALLVTAAMLSLPVVGAEEEHFLEYSEYNFAVNFISGNLTATVTPATLAPRDWPRIIFKHSTDILSPLFDVGMPTVHLFNDTNGDGVFSNDEATQVAYLSSMYNVSWNATAVEFGNDTLGGEYAWLRADAVVGLFEGPEDEYPVIDEWANVTFWFHISQKTETRSNAYGNYVVQGMVDFSVRFELRILQQVNASGLVLEHLLAAGGSADMFMLREDVGLEAPQLTPADGRVDETVNGVNFTHELNQTSLPCQDILFTKEDQTVQAHYRISSEPLIVRNGSSSPASMGISYYTTGDGLVVHTAYLSVDKNDTIVHEVIVGIDESGFTPRFRDWLKDNFALVMVVSGSIAAVICFGLLMLILRKHWGLGKKRSKDAPPDNKT